MDERLVNLLERLVSAAEEELTLAKQGREDWRKAQQVGYQETRKLQRKQDESRTLLNAVVKRQESRDRQIDLELQRLAARDREQTRLLKQAVERNAELHEISMQRLGRRLPGDTIPESWETVPPDEDKSGEE